MKIFLAGSTGAIGRPLISKLLTAGHKVTGITSSEHGVAVLKNEGAQGIVANALDAQAVSSAMKSTRPDVIINELTSLPKHYTREEMARAAGPDRTLRLEGGRNIYEAAKACGARRYIVQSTGFFYGQGAGLATEEDSLADGASPAVRASVQTYMEVEQRAFGHSDMEGIALRYGFFYGLGTWFTKDGDMAQRVRERQYPIIGSGQGVWSWVHIDDAAAATVAAIECEPGVYNIVDDDPSPMAVWLPAFAAYAGAPPPARISEEDGVAMAGPDAVYYATRLRGASNAKAKKTLGLAPRKLEWLH